MYGIATASGALGNPAGRLVERCGLFLDALVVLVGAAPGAAPGVEPRRGAGVHVRGLMGRLWLRLWLPLMIILALLTGWGLGAFMAWLFPSIFGPVPF